MSQAGYVFGAWSVTLAAAGVYAVSLAIRGRRLVRRARCEAGKRRDE